MDRDNLSTLEGMAPNASARGKISLLRSYDPDSDADADVPDPYYGGPNGFEDVFDICEAACRELLAELT